MSDLILPVLWSAMILDMVLTSVWLIWRGH